MQSRSRRVIQYLVLVVVTTIFFTVVYNSGMSSWENRPQSLYRSLEVVIQSFTTTGYGEDAPWQTPQMHLLVIVMQFAGIGLILTAVDVFAVPWLRNAVTPTIPTSISGVKDHVIICGHTSRTDAFLTELDGRDREYVLIEPDTETARDLHEAERQVVHGDPEATVTLENAQIDSAVAIVADVADDTNASIALSAQEANPEIRVITLIEDADLARYHQAAGVEEVLSPRQLLGESLAAKVPTAVTADIGAEVELGENFQIVELTVGENSDLQGQTFTEAKLRERFGVDVIGAWDDGDFETPVDPDDSLETGMILLVVGDSDRVDALRDRMGSSVHDFGSQRIILAGYGDSGKAAAEALSQTGSQITILDIESKEDVDVTGDARDPTILAEAGIQDASTLLLTVADDTTAIFATLIARELNPDLRIVVRANEESSVKKLYRSGASYVQSLATVSGRMLASTIFEDEEVLAFDKQVRIVRLPVNGLEGRTLAEEQVRTTTGCTVVEIIREGESITEFDPSAFTFESDDHVIVAGTDEAITKFEHRFSL